MRVVAVVACRQTTEMLLRRRFSASMRYRGLQTSHLSEADTSGILGTCRRQSMGTPALSFDHQGRASRRATPAGRRNFWIWLSRRFAAVQRSVWNLRHSGHRRSNADATGARTIDSLSFKRLLRRRRYETIRRGPRHPTPPPFWDFEPLLIKTGLKPHRLPYLRCRWRAPSLSL
jgi:hypothetical protein